ncbi:MAG: hypothetical protein ACOVK6_01575 [Ramlibacter sp.]
MPWFDDTIGAFGSQLGLRALTPPREGVLQLAFESGELLSLEAVAGRDTPQALVFMERPVGHTPEAVARGALVRAHLIHGDVCPVQVALRQSAHDWRLIALVRIPRQQFTVDRLAHSVELLRRWLDEALRSVSSHA